MTTLRVSMLGKTLIHYERPFQSNLPAKAMELFCFLLLNRHKSFRRESLAAQLWKNVSTARGKKYLRDALWRLQSEFESQLGLKLDAYLVMENDWVYIHADADIWVDAHDLEEAYRAAIKSPKAATAWVEPLRQAIFLYRGDLLEGWYQDWCIFERERLQLIYLQALDKLMLNYEENGRYEEGCYFGRLGLKYDWARERTHRRLMRLYYLAGDRTAALRQYQSCCAMLKKEFQVEPESKTVTLYQLLCKGASLQKMQPSELTHQANELIPPFLEDLQTLRVLIAQIQNAFSLKNH